MAHYIANRTGSVWSVDGDCDRFRDVTHGEIKEKQQQKITRTYRQAIFLSV